MKNNRPHGKGTVIYQNGSKREGNFTEGREDGIFIQTNNDGTIEKSVWIKGEKITAKKYQAQIERFIISQEQQYNQEQQLSDNQNEINENTIFPSELMAQFKNNVQRIAPFAYQTWMKNPEYNWGKRPENLIGQTSMKAFYIDNDNYCYLGEVSLQDCSIFHGKGFLIKKTFKNHFFIGWWINGQIQGKGKYFNNLYHMYEGDFLQNFVHGIGTYTYTDNGKYSGEWAKNEKHGKGELIFADGSRREQTFFQDKEIGIGIHTQLNGNKILFINDKRIHEIHYKRDIQSLLSDKKNLNKNLKEVLSNKNRSSFKENSIFNEFVLSIFKQYINAFCPIVYEIWNDLPSFDWGSRPLEILDQTTMNAVLCENDEQIYYGELLLSDLSKCHGKGILLNKKDNIIYECWFINDKINYRGRIIDMNKSTYEGELKNGKRHGRGCYTVGLFEEQQFICNWENDKMHGNAEVKTMDGFILRKVNYNQGNQDGICLVKDQNGSIQMQYYIQNVVQITIILQDKCQVDN